MELVFLAILILLMALALGSGYPVAFALPGSSIITILLAAICGYVFAGDPAAYFTQAGSWQWLSAGVTNLRGVYWEPDRDTLIAIPLFIFMGIMLQRSKIAEDLLITMAQLFGPVPGGLGISVVFVGALLAATTGIVGATVVAMGLISLPAMLRNNYSQSLATGTIAASGTLGQIIPPSIVLIILADQLASAADQGGALRKALHKASTGELSMPSSFDVSSTSAGEMFLGAFVPGLVLVGLYMVYILVFAFFNPKSAPAVPYEGEYDSEFWKKVFLTLIPPLALIFLVLGSIISGIATVNQAGAIGAVGALVMAGYRLKEGQKRAYWPAILAILSLVGILFVLANFDTNIKNIKTSRDALGITLAAIFSTLLMISLIWSGWRALKIEDTLQGVMIETAKATSLVFIILLGAAMLTAAFRAFGGEELVKEFLEGLPGGFWSKFVIVMAVIFFLGFFLDFIEIAVVVVPIVAPILLADPSANITAVWLGVMIGLNIQTSFLTPPFGFALFYLRGVAPAVVKTINMYKGVAAFILLQLVGLAIVGLYPPLVNYLPKRVSLLSETAPPPRNPQLQYCIEEYMGGQYAEGANALNQAIAQAKALDRSILPDSMAKDLSKAFDDAELAPTLLTQAKEAEAAKDNASGDYRPIHSTVRDAERDIRHLEEEAKVLEVRLSRETNQATKDRLQNTVERLLAEADELAKTIPANWPETYKQYKNLTAAEAKARTTYRRTADNAYTPIVEMLAVLNANEAFAGLSDSFDTLEQDIESNDAKSMVEPLKALEDKFAAVQGASEIKSEIGKARRALKSKKEDKAKALEAIAKAKNLYADQQAWRTQAGESILPGLLQYEAAIRSTIGLRQQPKLPREPALAVAACISEHRDVSLSF